MRLDSTWCIWLASDSVSLASGPINSFVAGPDRTALSSSSSPRSRGCSLGFLFRRPFPCDEPLSGCDGVAGGVGGNVVLLDAAAVAAAWAAAFADLIAGGIIDLRPPPPAPASWSFQFGIDLNGFGCW